MSPPHSHRVCIVLLTGLGDVVHGLPIANALKRSGFARHITWVAEPAPSYVVRPHGAVDNVVVYHKRAGLRGLSELRRDLRGLHFDWTLNLNVYSKSIWPTWFSRAPLRAGFDRSRSHEGVWLAAVNRHLPPNPRAHTQDMFLEFLDLLGVARPTALEWAIEFTEQERDAQQRFFEPLRDRPVVAIVPASANPKKDWVPERYARVIEALEANFNARALLVGGPSARERELASIITRESRGNPISVMVDDVRRMMWTVAGSDLVIAPDTGPVHVARARDVPVIGLYGHTNPWRVGPYRKYEDLWVDRYTEPGTAPDPSNATPKLGRMELISVADVLERVRVAFDRYLTAQ